MSVWISLDENASCCLFVCAAMRTHSQHNALVVFLTAECVLETKCQSWWSNAAKLLIKALIGSHILCKLACYCTAIWTLCVTPMKWSLELPGKLLPSGKLHIFSGDLMLLALNLKRFFFFFLTLGLIETGWYIPKHYIELSTAGFQSSYLIRDCFTSWIKNQMCFSA